METEGVWFRPALSMVVRHLSFVICHLSLKNRALPERLLVTRNSLLVTICMDVKIKTFRIESSADEQSLNEFLNGKIIRHWGTTYEASAEGGSWNVFLAYEIR